MLYKPIVIEFANEPIVKKMTQDKLPTQPPPTLATPVSRAANLGYAAVAGQAGCFTLGIILIALFGGIWLDAQFGTRGPFVMGLLLISIPFSLFVMVRIALGAIGEIRPPARQEAKHDTQEDSP